MPAGVGHASASHTLRSRQMQAADTKTARRSMSVLSFDSQSWHCSRLGIASNGTQVRPKRRAMVLGM